MEYIKYLSIIFILSFTTFTHAGPYVEDIFLEINKGDVDKASKICIENNDQEMLTLIKLKEYISTNYFKYSFEEIANFIIQNPSWPYQTTLRINAEKLINTNSNKKLIYLFLSKLRPLTPNGHKYYAYVGSLFIKSEDKLSSIIANGWYYGNFDYEEQAEYRQKFIKYLSYQDDITRTNRLLWDSREVEAGHMIENLEEPERYLVAARIGLQQDLKSYNILFKDIPNHYLEASEQTLASIKKSLKPDIQHYSKLLTAVPEKYKNDPGLVYDYCCKCRKLDSINQEATNLLIQIPKDNTHAHLWWKLKAYFIRENIKIQDYTSAYNLAKNHKASSAAHISEGEWLAGWIALRFLKKPELAKPHFLRFIQVVQTPLSLARGHYWLGRTYRKLGMPMDATQAFEEASRNNYTFYGMLASRELGHTQLNLSQYSEWSTEDIIQFKQNWYLKVAKKIAKYDPKIALEFANVVIAKITDKKKLLAALYSLDSPGMDYFNLEISRIAAKKGVVYLPTLYPLPLTLDKSKVDINHTYSVIRLESGFNNNAFDQIGQSPGLMQLIPETACRVSHALNIPFDLNRLANDPSYNILLGTEHLFALNNLYEHSLILTSCAYNAGHHRVHEWINRRGDPRTIRYLYDVIDWIELIPFEITRNYVQRIIENVQIYKIRRSKSNKLEIRELIMGRI